MYDSLTSIIQYLEEINISTTSATYIFINPGNFFKIIIDIGDGKQLPFEKNYQFTNKDISLAIEDIDNYTRKYRLDSFTNAINELSAISRSIMPGLTEEVVKSMEGNVFQRIFQFINQSIKVLKLYAIRST